MSKAAAVLIVICICWRGEIADTLDARSETVFEHQEQPKELEPEYAKWSRIAFHEAGKVYTLLDYKYLGRSNVAPGVSQQKFRFWVKKNDSEFPLIVSIRYNPVTQKMYTIMMEEERRNLQDL
jgi:hypothetical protein